MRHTAAEQQVPKLRFSFLIHADNLTIKHGHRVYPFHQCGRRQLFAIIYRFVTVILNGGD